jgi:hypothetical protein
MTELINHNTSSEEVIEQLTNLDPDGFPGPNEKPEIEPDALPQEDPGIQPNTDPGKEDDDDDDDEDDDPFREIEIGDDPDEEKKKIPIM